MGSPNLRSRNRSPGPPPPRPIPARLLPRQHLHELPRQLHPALSPQRTLRRVTEQSRLHLWQHRRLLGVVCVLLRARV